MGREADVRRGPFDPGGQPEMRSGNAMGLGAWHLYGSYQTVAEEIRALHDAGLESILTSFFDPIRGLHQIEDDVVPLLRKMGLRQ